MVADSVLLDVPELVARSVVVWSDDDVVGTVLVELTDSVVLGELPSLVFASEVEDEVCSVAEVASVLALLGSWRQV